MVPNKPFLLLKLGTNPPKTYYENKEHSESTKTTITTAQSPQSIEPSQKPITTARPVAATTTTEKEDVVKSAGPNALISSAHVPKENTKINESPLELGIEWRIRFEIKMAGASDQSWKNYSFA